MTSALRYVRHIAFASLLLACSVPSISAQNTKAKGALPRSAKSLIAVDVKGTDRYTGKELLDACGVKLGQEVDEQDFRNAATHLGESGLFSDVAYTYSYSPQGTKLEFQLTDVDRSTLVPAHFENFVWFTDAELSAELEKRVPLFKGLLPPGGTLADRVTEALQAVLEEKHLPGHVDYLREGTQGGDKIIGVAYSISGVDFIIQHVEFPGATADLLPGLQSIARRLSGAKYVRSSLEKVAEVDFLPVCLKHGYLKASFTPPSARVASQTQDEVDVDATFPLTPGKVYSTSAVAWHGNSVTKSEELQMLIHLPIGQPADAVRLDSDLQQVSQAYRNKGYMKARVSVMPALDEATATVRYDLNVSEGDQFKMGELEILGLDSQAHDRLVEAWELAEGQPYDASYPMKFAAKSAKVVPGIERWGANIHEDVDEKDKTVDVTIKFSPR